MCTPYFELCNITEDTIVTFTRAFFWLLVIGVVSFYLFNLLCKKLYDIDKEDENKEESKEAKDDTVLVLLS